MVIGVAKVLFLMKEEIKALRCVKQLSPAQRCGVGQGCYPPRPDRHYDNDSDDNHLATVVLMGHADPLDFYALLEALKTSEVGPAPVALKVVARVLVSTRAGPTTDFGAGAFVLLLPRCVQACYCHHFVKM